MPVRHPAPYAWCRLSIIGVRVCGRCRTAPQRGSHQVHDFADRRRDSAALHATIGAALRSAREDGTQLALEGLAQ
jgi:nicotinic acid phosphoribosyltransferase